MAEQKTMSLKAKLMNIQVELKAPKNLHNSYGNYNYRNAEGILEALKPYEAKYKVCVIISDEIIGIGDRIYVKAIATIRDISSDEEITAVAYAREAETKKGMDDAQVTGATSSYARKYALNGLFLLDDTKDVDTDEYQAQKNKAEAKSKKTSETTAKADDSVYQETKKAYMALAAYCTENNIDLNVICQTQGLNKQSTKADFEAALEYAKSL